MIDQLKARRVEIIAMLKALPSGAPVGRREELQADLSNVNAKIKEFNIAESRRLKSVADARKARGLAEHAANLQRAGLAASPAPTTAPDPEPFVAERHMPASSLGEHVIIQAERLIKAIDKIPLARRLPHTVLFHERLVAFIHAQRELLANERAQNKLHESTEPADCDWRKTWEGGAA